MKINHFIGGILLVAGTTVGAGMLALPVMSAFAGFYPSLVILFLIWLVMLATSYFFLDVNCSIKGEVNLISMVHKTLGTWGKGLSWIVYLLLLYSLTAAYIAASSSLFTSAIAYITGYTLPDWISLFFLPLVFGGFVYLGTLGVDLINRFLMFGLIISYIFLIGFLPEHMEGQYLLHVDWASTLLIFPVAVTSFGYHIIIPSLTTYMGHDRKKLRIILFVGSLIPLIIYILWQLLILGVVPIQGKESFVNAWKGGTLATIPLTRIIASRWISIGANFFSFFAIVTSFLGVTLSLSDFLTDGCKIKEGWKGRIIACLLTFIPPLVFVFTYERGFFVALEYGGAFVAILLIFLPAMMAWKLKKPPFYRTLKGRILLIFVILFAFFIVILDVLEQWGVLRPLLSRYIDV